VPHEQKTNADKQCSRQQQSAQKRLLQGLRHGPRMDLYFLFLYLDDSAKNEGGGIAAKLFTGK
jgi:hypothetical protein